LIEKVEGIILSETPYKETSKILQVYTKEYGLISMIAKGAKSLKSNLRVGTGLYTYGYFYLYYKENKLSPLTNVDIINNFNDIKTDLTLISYLAYLCDLTRQVLKDNPNTELFDLLIAGIKAIDNHLDPLIITNIIEIKYLDYLGVGLNLDSCVKCGATKNIVTIDPDLGGFVCQNCYQNEAIVSPKTIKMIRMYYYVDIKSITKIKVSKEISQEINDFVTRYYDRYTGLYLRTKDFLNKILQNT
jgi:DNA repair protein RecO (recombination protein O)